jgi:hypothetical protein
MIRLIVILLVLFFLLGGGGYYGMRGGFGPTFNPAYVGSGFGGILLILLILWFLGVI